MTLFNKTKKTKKFNTKSEYGTLYAPITGNYIPIEEIPDEAFSQGILGQGCGIEPENGVVMSPVDGVMTVVSITRHALGITSNEGAEFLIHVGLDTVEMNGKGFSVMVKQGDKVSCGDILMKFDLAEIERAGHPATTAFVLTNSDEFSEFNIITGKYYKTTEEIGVILK